MGQHQHLYQSTSWRKLRKQHLVRNPLCVKCIEAGTPAPGTVVDHKQPHRGNLDLFFNPLNLQTLCREHHNRDKQREEVRGHLPDTDEAGLPIDPRHPWNRVKGIGG
jgi:5-methylcytosine-specific restriction endonuclease McrA